MEARKVHMPKVTEMDLSCTLCGLDKAAVVKGRIQQESKTWGSPDRGERHRPGRGGGSPWCWIGGYVSTSAPGTGAGDRECSSHTSCSLKHKCDPSARAGVPGVPGRRKGHVRKR